MIQKEEEQLEIDIDELRKRKIFVMTPMYGGMCTSSYTKCMMDTVGTFDKLGLELRWHSLCTESLITRARNYLASLFLKSDATHLMFIDADIEFNPQQILLMLSLADPKSDKDVVCAAYPKKQISWEKVYEAVNQGMVEKNGNDPEILENFVGDMVFGVDPSTNNGTIDVRKPVEVMESGTGFMLIQRHVFEKFAKAHPELLYNPDHVRTKDFDGSEEITGFFMDPLTQQIEMAKTVDEIRNFLLQDTEEIIEKEKIFLKLSEIDNKLSSMPKRHLSEDYFFCHEIRKLGMKVWLCPWMDLNHIGTYKYIGNLQAMAAIGAAANVDISKIKKK